MRILEKSFSKVIQRGGLPGNAANQARLAQFIKGAVESDLTLIQLILRDKRDNLPTFLDLLKEIREAEDLEAARRPAPHQHVHVAQADEGTELDVHHETQLRAEIAELKAKLKEQRNTLSLSANERHTKGPRKKSNTKSQPNREIQSLRAEVYSLKNQLRVMTGQSTHYSKRKQEYDRTLTP